MYRKISSVLYIIIGLVVSVGPYTFLHVCGSGMSMEGMDMDKPVCQGIPPVAAVVGAIIIVLGIVNLITAIKGNSNKVVKIIPELLALISGVVTIGLPTFIIGVCDSAHMHCNMVTRPALIVIGAITVVASIIGLVTLYFSEGSNRND